MKTILITHNFRRTSFSEMSVDLAIHLAELGNDVIFVSYRPFYKFPEEYPTKKGKLIIYSWPTKKRPIRFVDFVFFIKLYLKHKPNIVLSHFASSNIALSVSKILSIGRVKTIDYCHTLTEAIAINGNSSPIIHKIRKIIFYRLFVDRIICVSDMARLDLVKHFYCNPNKAITVLNPLKDRYKNQSVTPKIKKIHYLGGLNKAKGIDILIDAFEAYLKQNPSSNLQLTIAGGGHITENIISRIKSIYKITFIGELSYDAIDNFIVDSYAIIIPSLHDALNLVGIETLMNKKLLAISTNTGLAQYLTLSECLKFKPEFEDIFITLEKFEKMEEKEYSLFIENGRSKYLQLFNMEDYLKKMINLLLK
jgi:glycosyltransferase involved in cell wall biosynthesis